MSYSGKSRKSVLAIAPSNLHSSCASVISLTMGCQQEGTSLSQWETPLSEHTGSFQPLKAMVGFYLLHRPTPAKSTDLPLPQGLAAAVLQNQDGFSDQEIFPNTPPQLPGSFLVFFLLLSYTLATARQSTCRLLSLRSFALARPQQITFPGWGKLVPRERPGLGAALGSSAGNV